MATGTSRQVLRYLPTQRWVHWMGAAGFVMLLLSGLVLLWPPLAPLAAGGWSRMLHRVGAVLYVLWPILYAILNPKLLAEVVRESVTYGRDEWKFFLRMPGYFFGRTGNLPPQGRVNAGQKVHHLGVGVTSIMVVLTGLVLWFGKGQLGANGLAVTVMLHDLVMLVLTVLLVGHVYFTFLYGALPAMLTGYVSESYARLEHPKWLATLHVSPPAGDGPAVATGRPALAAESASPTLDQGGKPR